MRIDPNVEFEGSIDFGAVYYNGDSLTIVLDTGEDHGAIVLDHSDLDTDELDFILADEGMTRSAAWSVTDRGELTAPVLIGPDPALTEAPSWL
jgi:hypothetical protein